MFIKQENEQFVENQNNASNNSVFNQLDDIPFFKNSKEKQINSQLNMNNLQNPEKTHPSNPLLS